MGKILIIDFGSQFTQLVSRRIRELGVYSEIYPHYCGEKRIRDFNPDGIILSGGPQSTLTTDAATINPTLFTIDKPILGICYGMQALIHHFGGTLESEAQREYGGAMIKPHDSGCLLWDGLNQSNIRVWMSHGDHLSTLPTDFRTTATSNKGIIASIAHRHKHYYGVQFHPEVSHTEQGMKILGNFVDLICRIKHDWTATNIAERAIHHIRQQVGQDKVILGLSGGVDSTVVAALLHRAIGQQLNCVMVDNGLLRANEVDGVRSAFENEFKNSLHIIDAQQQFYTQLKGITDPEEKRRRIGHLFIEIFEDKAKKLGDSVKWLAQGTIYPDIVESAKDGTTKAAIKTHHNVGGLPERLNLQLLEPIRDLFKDEVRQLGQSLGISSSLLERHPFPGPGLAVRILGEVTPERITMVRAADAIFIDELHHHNAYHQTAQAFAVLLPIQSVGVMGDNRTYESVIALRAVTTDDFMTADWTRLHPDLLAQTAQRIINEVHGINRVVYDISSKPPATIEWE